MRTLNEPSSNETLPTPTRLVAVVGLGCVMPDANTVEEFWANVKNGRNSVREVPKERWDPDLFWSPDRSAPDKSYSKIGSFVTGFKFDPMKFRIPPSVVRALDDSQLWAMAAAQQALNDSGYDKKPFDRSRCAVILGNAMGGESRMATGFRIAWPIVRKTLLEMPGLAGLPPVERERLLREAEVRYKAQFPEITEDTMPGELSNVIAGRIANFLNLTGKNFTTDAACASSLAAIDAAVQALVTRECDLVLTGGVDRSQDVGSYVKFCKIGALSGEGSFPFDARADGFVMGEGCGLLLLKRLEDAQRDGDRIYGIIRGVGSSSDGKGKGITAPNLEGQLSCITRALADAQTTPETIDLIECHGTGTKVGDVVEVQGLTKIFGPHASRKQSIPIGSVKSNIGHLKSAAGAAALIKVILALHHKTLPPSINYERPNPNLKLEETPFYVNTRTQPWPEPSAGRPRRAGVSSFGFGGTNFHVVLEEYAPGKNTPRGVAGPSSVATPLPASAPSGGVVSVLLTSTPQHRELEPLAKGATTEVLVVGAGSPEALEAEARRVQQELTARVTSRNFASYLHALNAAGLRRTHRVACVVDSPTDAIEKLAQAIEGLRDSKKRPLLATKGIHFGQGATPGKIGFLFPGQGSQYVDMMRDLSTRFETIKRTLDESDRIMTPLVGKPLTHFMFLDVGRGVDREQAEEALKRTEICQPAVLAADLALHRLLGAYDIRPDMVAGHSLGEYGALVAAGVLTFEDALLAVSARGREMANVHVPDLGKMASVSADPATVEAKLKAVQGYVIPANKNCKAQTVIAGGSSAVDAAVQMFNAQGISAQPIPVSAAFHSAIVAPAREPLRRVFERLDFREPKTPVLSNVHADYYPNGPGARDRIIDLLSQQVAAPVEWQRQIERMHHEGVRTFLEVGPKATLTTFVKNILEDQPHQAAATNHPKKGGFFHFNDAIAMLAAAGHPVRFPAPHDAKVHLAAYRESVEPYADATPAAEPAPTPMAASAPIASMIYPNLAKQAEAFIRDKQEELRRLLTAQIPSLAPGAAGAPTTPAADPELLALKRRVETLGLNLDRILISGVSVGTPGTFKQLFDDRNFERIFGGENAIEPMTPQELEKQVEKNIVRLVKAESGDHRFEIIQDVAEVIKLAAKKGEFDFEREYGINHDFADALDITSKMAIAAGIEALKDAQIPLVRGYVKTTTGKFLPGEWALPEPLQAETGIIFGSVWPGVPKIVEYVARFVTHKYTKKSHEELQSLYRELIGRVRDPAARGELEAWYAANEPRLHQEKEENLFEFNRRFLFHVLGMGHSQLAQFIRAKGPNTLINAACATTTQGVAIAEDWIRTGRCKRIIVVGADDITGPEMLEFWASGFLAAGAATTKGDVREAALPFDRRRHGMIIGMGAVGIVVEAESEVKARGMEGIVEVLATTTLNSAYHGSRLDTSHIATVMDDLVGTVERRTGVSRSEIAKGLLFMSHETYTPARGGSAAAEIEALTKTFGPDVGKVVVANTKGFTGHPMGASIEDAIAIRSLQTGRVPPIANLREPDPSLGNIQLSRGGHYDVEYALRLAAGFGSQIAMFACKLRSRDVKRILDPAQYMAWVSRVSGTKNAELEVVNRTLRVKASLPPLMEPAAQAARAPPAAAPPIAAPAVPKPTGIPAATSRVVSNLAAVQTQVVDLIAEKTGYPKDMLEPNLDLEADLGIDTVKQAELFGILRESHGLAPDDAVQLKDYNTVGKIAEYLQRRLESVPTASPSPSVAIAAPAAHVPTPARAPTPPATVAVAPARDAVANRLLALVVEKTGYPKDMLEPNLDLEADLGIDTVKQAEIFGIIRSEFNLEREENIQLKDYNTLHKITEYIASRAVQNVPAPVTPVSPLALPAVPAPEARPSEPIPAAPAKAGGRDRRGVIQSIRGLIADKTGYPTDLLDENLDLEADLGIDTVKQAEVFGLMRESFGIASVENVQLKDYNTIGRFADFVLQHGTTPAAPAAPAPPVVVPTVTTVPPATPRTTRRYVVRYVPVAPTPSEGRLMSKVLLVWAPAAHRADLLYALKNAGATGLGLDLLPRSFDEARSQVEELRRLNPRINGLVFVATPNPLGSEYEAEDAAPVKALFFLVKALLSTGKTGELDSVSTVTFLGGDFGASMANPLNPLEGALVGLAKAIAKELPSAAVKCVDFSAKTSPGEVAKALVEELLRRDGLVEVGTSGGRGTLKLLDREPAEEEPGVEWGPQDVVLVSGGGAGITSDIVIAMARRAPAAFLLLGRTPLPTNVEELARKTADDWNATRREITQTRKEQGERITPVTIEREIQKLQKAAEVHRTLQALRAAGARAEYHACDVTDAKATERVLAQVRKSLGPITGVLHAAGVEESKLIVDKTSESFDRVFDVKVLGARNLLRAAANDPLKFFASFGSVAGRFGNAGQADYSAANDALAKLSHALRQERGIAFSAFTIDWSAWADKGMATRGSVMTVLREAGVAPIPLAEGVGRFVHELAHGGHDPEIVVAAELGRLAPQDTFTSEAEAVRVATAPALAARPPTLAEAKPAERGQTVLVFEEPDGRTGNLLTRIAHEDPHSVTSVLHLDPEKDPYLREHAVDGTPYLPGVFGLEAFVETAQRLAPGLRYVGAQALEFKLPVKLLRNRPIEVTIVASVATESPTQVEVGCRLQSLFINAKGERMGAPRIHFTGTLLFARDAATPPPAWPVPATHRTVDPAEIYRAYFHGPSFQVLRTLELSSDGQTVLGRWGNPDAPLFGDRKAEFLAHPLWVELAFQTAGGHELYREAQLALPNAIRHLRQYPAPDPGEPLLALARAKGGQEGLRRFDVVVQTEAGRVVLELGDFELIRVRSLVETAVAPAPAPVTPTPIGEGQAVYRSRWGHDFPLPYPGVTASRVELKELESLQLSPDQCLTSGERQDQERYRHDGRRREFFAGRLAAKEAIARLLDRPVREARGIEVRRLETGEPVARGQGLEEILVSITHTHAFAIAVAGRRGPLRSLGVDAERVEEKPRAFEEQSFAPPELGLLDELNIQGQRREELQCLFWATKEAVLKALGKGFALDLHDVRVQRLEGDRVRVELTPPAQACLAGIGANQIQVLAWLADGHAYALATTRP